MAGTSPNIQIVEESSEILSNYGMVSIAFTIANVLDVIEQPDGTIRLDARPADPARVKDYDEHGEHPSTWSDRFDVTNWGFFSAMSRGEIVGHAAVAWNTPALDMLDGRTDLAVLWDIRVEPEARGKGVGRALFNAAMSWANWRGCRQLKVETQNNNVAACLFYQRMGCVLQASRPTMYPEFPDETQLIWMKTVERIR